MGGTGSVRPANVGWWILWGRFMDDKEVVPPQNACMEIDAEGPRIYSQTKTKPPACWFFVRPLTPFLEWLKPAAE